MNNALNVTTGKPRTGGAVFRAPLGTTLPEDASTALTSVFTHMGYVSDDGLTNSNSMETDSIKAWGGDTVLSYQTDREDVFSLTFIESSNAEVLKSVYGEENVTVGDSLTKVAVNSKELSSYVWVFDMILNNNKLKRIVLPNAKITELGDIVYKDDEPVGYEVSLTAIADEQGNTHYEYIE